MSQSGQSRTFAYDMLSRLICASNPESRVGTPSCLTTPLPSGLDRFTYDANGNLLTKTDSRAVTVTFAAYDALNRPTSKSYSDGTPAVTFTHDQQKNGCFNKGRVTGVLAGGVFKTDLNCYDQMGRVKESVQTTPPAGTARVFAYQYNVDGTLRQQTYPSLRIINYSYDAAGRTSSLASGATQYGSGIQYAPHGALAQMTLGNSKVEQNCFNTRLQPDMIRLGTGATTNCANSNNVWHLALGYTAGLNNGNVVSQTITAPGVSSMLQSYLYDDVNRIKSVSETGWSQTYSYDAFGNRAATGTNVFANTPQNLSAYTATTNRLTTTWADYDAAGNLTWFKPTGYVWSAAYDAENRQIRFCSGTTSCGATSPTAEYRYDGEGRRVQKLTATTTTYVYDVFGQLAAEYSNAAPSGPTGAFYRTVDHLGSTRLVTDATGPCRLLRDYFPFGEQIPASATFGNRNQVTCFSGSTPFPQQFTAKERDAETGLDFFGARYFSGAQGRFTSPDPFNPVDELIGPELDDYLSNLQYWNKYAYSLNNPLKYKDSDGNLPHAVVGGLVGGGVGGALERYSQIRSGQDIKWAKVATKTGVGAAVGATAAATFGGSLLLQGGSLAVVNSAAGIADRALDNDSTTQALDKTAVVTDAIVGGVTGVVGGVVGKQAQTAVQNSAGQKLNERLADHGVRATAQRSASRQASARQAQQRVAQHPETVARRAAGAGRAAAKAGTTAAAQRAAEALKKRKEEEER